MRKKKKQLTAKQMVREMAKLQEKLRKKQAKAIDKDHRENG